MNVTMMGMKRIARIVLLMDSLCKSWTARLLPLVSATLLCVKVGEQAEHLNLDLAELRLGGDGGDKSDDEEVDDDDGNVFEGNKYLKKLVNYQEVDSADVDFPVLILERGCRIYYHLSSVEPGQLKKG